MSGAYGDQFAPIVTVPLEDSSREDALMRGGMHADKIITLSANAATAQENIFQITGSVDLIIQLEVIDATVLVNCTDISLQVWDGSVADQISKTGPGAVISGFNVGAWLFKNEVATSALEAVNNDQGRYIEASTNKALFSFKVMQKTGVTTYIRLQYTTTDAPINAQLEAHAIWVPNNGGTLVAV